MFIPNLYFYSIHNKSYNIILVSGLAISHNYICSFLFHWKLFSNLFFLSVDYLPGFCILGYFSFCHCTCFVAYFVIHFGNISLCALERWVLRGLSWRWVIFWPGSFSRRCKGYCSVFTLLGYVFFLFSSSVFLSESSCHSALCPVGLVKFLKAGLFMDSRMTFLSKVIPFLLHFNSKYFISTQRKLLKPLPSHAGTGFVFQNYSCIYTI